MTTQISEEVQDSTESDVSQRITPAMMAELVGVSVRTVRRWQRAGFIRPVCEVMQLPQFDYCSLALAKQLADWMKQGASVGSIQSQLERLQDRCGQQLSLDELPITAEGGYLLLRAGEHLLEATGQFRFGFEDGEEQPSGPATIQLHTPSEPHNFSVVSADSGENSLETMINEALTAEDAGELDIAVQWYRCALTTHGPSADLCFQVAELLYRSGDIDGARERYFMALELNPELIEARANLGCVLAEAGQLELAVAAFEGALEQFSDYADVHFHLARTLDDLNDNAKAAEHWQEFLRLSPASPWAEEAKVRLSEDVPLLQLGQEPCQE